MAELEESKLFHGLSAEELLPVKAAARLLAFPANHRIFKEGDPGDGIYVVRSGQVGISVNTSQSQAGALTKINPGDFFGEMAVLDNEPRSASAVTSEATEAWFIPRDELLLVLEATPRLAVGLVREFSLRMREFNRQYLREVLQAEKLTLVGRFARSIVHDFKNPLNVIGLAAELMQMQKATPAMREGAAIRIGKQVRRLSNMINELLEFTRGSQNSIILAETPYIRYISELVEELRFEVSEKGVELVVENEPPDLVILMDPQRMSHVFYNIIHNAVDALGGAGKIILRFEVRGREVVTEIEDTGRGFAPEIVGRLFEAFATHGKAQGTGLGLSICKRIVEDHNGWIKARAEEGRGAIFAFGLPFTQR